MVNDAFEPHIEACAWLAGREDRAYNTQRTSAGRVALYLSYCTAYAVDWSCPSLAQLMAMMRWLIDEPLPPKGRRPAAEPRFRGKGTVSPQSMDPYTHATDQDKRDAVKLVAAKRKEARQ